MNDVYLLTGGNVGNRLYNLTKARDSLATLGQVIESSAVYETAAWGKQDQEAFLNQVIHLQTDLSPLELLDKILSIEEEMGRVRAEKYGPRIIDIDILFFNEDIVHLPGLTIPHPFLQERRFVLEPLAEIAPSLWHPELRTTVAELLEVCQDALSVNKFT